MLDTAFFFDIDNTLIYSYKYKCPEDICIEWKNDQEQGFMTPLAYNLFKKLINRIMFIPVTTRSVEQYQRIVWPGNYVPEYALTSNGAILLYKGTIDENWRTQSLKRIRPYTAKFDELLRKLNKLDIFSHCRIVDKVYVFAKYKYKEGIPADYLIKTEVFDIVRVGQKVYVFPKGMNKGSAVLQLKGIIGTSYAICAGDGIIDIPMLKVADLPFAPNDDIAKKVNHPRTLICIPEKNYAEFILETLYKKYT